MKALITVLAGLLVLMGPAFAQQTAMDRCLAVYSMAECDRLASTPAPEEDVLIIDEVAYAPDPFPNLPPVRTWHGAGWMCLPENDPPEGWLNPGGFCSIVNGPPAKASLMYRNWK